jgi:predicted transcriptional regulator
MQLLTVSLPDKTYDRIQKLSDELDLTPAEVIQRAVSELHQSEFMNQVILDYERIARKP